MKIRTTLNISDDVIKEAEIAYNTKNRSKAVEMALRDAIRYKKIQMMKSLKGNIRFDEDALNGLRSKDRYE